MEFITQALCRIGALVALFLVLPMASAEDHWAFQPLTSPDLPIPSPNPIDAFIAAELAEQKLQPGPRASAATLIRRATFDLVGLPPSPSEVEAFVAACQDDPDDAFDALVERLLKSRHYGERWGRHWLDLVRYADTAGDAADFPVPEAYKYRNYVIDAFNRDKAYDQFIREQIAGDLLPFEDDGQRWEQTIATGYVAISRRIGVSPHSLRHITIEDTLDNLGKTFLGLTIACARCHDHKFDPVSTRDYYALYGFFDSSVYPHAGAEHKPWREDFVYRIGERRATEELGDLRKDLAAWRQRERAKLKVYKSFQTEKVTDPTLTRESTWENLTKTRAELAEFAATFPDLEIAYALGDSAGHDVHVQKQGSPAKRDQGELAPRQFLEVLGGQKLPDDLRGSGRQHLADWIAAPDNPLTARVMVNRIWQHHFGQGLVKTTSDFGIRGTPPTHPELLDYLARYFIGHNWSVKAMHRLIMNSDTYRRSSGDIATNSASDPENDYLWRANRRRLDAEQVRDSVLAFAGKLDLSPGGRHPFPHRLTYFYRQHEPFQESYPSDKRSVYLMQQRIQKNPFLDLFDGPDGNLPLATRNESTTALQALYFMNSEFAHKQAEAIATRLLTQPTDTAGHVDWAYMTIFGRRASERDHAQATAHLARVQDELGKSEQRAWSGYIRGMISSNEFMFVD